jgi:ABC-2 type transport system ATP-binding protein
MVANLSGKMAMKDSSTNVTALSLKGVSMKYGDFTALSGVSLEISSGEIFGFLGPNGAGKTTTIKLLAGLMEPSEGTIEVYGIPMAIEPSRAKELIGYIPDRPFLYDKLTADEYVAFVAGLWGMDKATACSKVTSYFEKFRIDTVRTKLIEGYSHGMKQKLVMSAALVHDPQLLIVDEPTVGLDPASVLVMKDLYRSMAERGTAIFLSTHSLAVAENVCDRIAILNKGKMIALGTMAQLQNQAANDGGNLEELFLALTNEDNDSLVRI